VLKVIIIPSAIKDISGSVPVQHFFTNTKKPFMLNFKIYNSSNPIPSENKTVIIEFLHKHLEQFCDPKESIEKAISYAMNENSGPGGFVLQGKLEEETVGVVVMNKTGMEDYIPANILVYIAVDPKFRGKGFGKELMKKAIDNAEGSVKLHVEHDNPARFLYEKLGFTNKYMEMRLIR
jgi:[ribosomal protein S18]-alanine N-acetyltransferase